MSVTASLVLEIRSCSGAIRRQLDEAHLYLWVNDVHRIPVDLRHIIGPTAKFGSRLATIWLSAMSNNLDASCPR